MSLGHLADQIRHKELKGHNKIHVIGVIQNSVRYHSRYRLFRQWAKEMANSPHVELHVVEAVYGDRHPECMPRLVCEPGFPDGPDYNYMSVHTNSEIWLKENLINLGVRHLLPRDWKYMAWIDCDVSFRNENWAQETMHQLQHYQIVQPWSDAVDLSFDGGIHKHFQSFGYLRSKNIHQAASASNPYGHRYGHTGFGWSCTRAFYEGVEKLLDFAILGSGDAHMAYGCIGRALETINGHMSHGYKHAAHLWQKKALHACAGLVGYTPGRIEHHFHGPKQRRQYANRWQILVKYKFDPFEDLKYDHQGVLKLKGKPELEQAIMRYNRERFEDSIEQY